MGKAKKARQKLHGRACVVHQQGETTKVGVRVLGQGATASTTVGNTQPSELVRPLSRGTSSEIFRNISITPDILANQKVLLDSDRMSIATTNKSSVQMKKKDKRKERHDAWLQKVGAITQAKEKQKTARRRANLPIVGDLKPLEDALPTLDLLLKESGRGKMERNEEPIKVKWTRSVKQKQKQMMEDMKTFQQVLNHPEYQKNPLGVISLHLKNKIQEQTL
ncbi:PREDICTED: protein FAM207A-like [Priapulus caudatus]|uniref:Protein FAM207A-like n=1 Tax=Priapulus caudatus TaxID=37621 RepID=A0ABM1ENN6_PRICU|nr:PREDICTED: protein FAM207A-like [Priapulus caudatus]